MYVVLIYLRLKYIYIEEKNCRAISDSLCNSYLGNITTHPKLLTPSPGEPHSALRESFGSDHLSPSIAFVWLSRAKVKTRMLTGKRAWNDVDRPAGQ